VPHGRPVRKGRRRAIFPDLTRPYDTGMYEHFEHTADLGLRVRAADMDTLFAEAAEALFAAVVEDLSTVEPREPTTIRVSGTDLAYLLFD